MWFSKFLTQRHVDIGCVSPEIPLPKLEASILYIAFMIVSRLEDGIILMTVWLHSHAFVSVSFVFVVLHLWIEANKDQNCF